MHWLHRFLLVVLLSPLAGAWASGGKPTCPAEPIRVGFFEFGILFTVERGNNRGFGLDRDLAFELEKRSGCRFEGDLMSRARIWVELREGRLDMTFSALKTPEREAMGWMFPYAIGYQVVLVSAKVPVEARGQQGFMSRHQLKFGVVRGFRHSPYYDALIDQLRGEGRVVEAVDEAQLISMVTHGSVDAIVSLPTVYSRYLPDDVIGKDVLMQDWDTKKEPVVGHLLLSRKTFNAAEAEKWRALLEEMQRDGTLLAIGMRYLGKEQARRLMIGPK
ncbi:MAG TPA: transporter substrate-binding domain-containing protein [Rhodocyclaceae bacterium]|nr:transporter substrate-binding domain-containing protein [Rhodocyclaceae bacterium]